MLKQLHKKIIEWAAVIGIFEKGRPIAQCEKTFEEVSELMEALKAQNEGLTYFTNSKGVVVNTAEQIKDGIGDSMVTLIIQAKMQGLTVEECLQHAYDIIIKRVGKGKMINGTFVKNEEN